MSQLEEETLQKRIKELEQERDNALLEVGRLHLQLEQQRQQTSTREGNEFEKLTLQELAARWERYGVSRDKDEKTRQNDAWVLKMFVEYLGKGFEVRNLREHHLDDYRAYLGQYKSKRCPEGLSKESIKTYLRPVKAMLRWAVRRRYLPVMVLDEDRMLGEPQEPKPTFTAAEFEKLLAAAAEEGTELLRLRGRAILLLLADTGMRASELCGARFKDIMYTVDLKGKGYMLRVQGAKRTGIREVPVRPVVYQAIAAYRQEMKQAHGRGRKQIGFEADTIFVSHRGKGSGKPMTVRGLEIMCARLARKAKVDVGNPHAYRRFFADQSINEDEEDAPDYSAVQAIGGWKDKKTLARHYAKRSAVSAAKWHEKNGPLKRFKEL